MMRLLSSGLTMVALVSAHAAIAQTVDYTNAEQMFGEPVTVSVTGQPQRASQAPANITVLTADDIRRSGAVDIPAALRFVPGLDVRNYGQFQSAVGIRGYNTAFNPRVLVLVDGRQVYNDDYGYTVWSLIPVTIAEIRQIEIIKGPNAALYGFNAVSGVINIVTYDPLRDRKSSITAVGGTQDMIHGAAVVTVQPSDRMGIRVSAKGSGNDEFDGPTVADSVLRPDRRMGSVDMRARLTDDVQLDLSASLGALKADQYIDIGSYFASDLEAGSLRGVLTGNTPLGLMQLDVYHNTVDQLTTYPGLANEWNQSVTVVKASDLFRPLPDHTIRIGAEYRHNAIESDKHFGGEMTSDLLAGSASWNWQIRSDLSWTNAARIDTVRFERNSPDLPLPGIVSPFGDRTYTETSYNSALLYSPTDYDTFRVSTARALQLPSLFSYGFQTNFGPLYVLGSRFLDPSASTNYEIGYERKLPELSSSISFDLFYQKTNQTIGSPFGSGLAFSPLGMPYLSARNFNGSEATGGEIELKGASQTGWRWSLAYSLALLEDETPEAILRHAPSVAYETQTPAHSVTGGLGFTWGNFEVDTAAKWQSHFNDFRADSTSAMISEIEIDDHVTVNARVGYRLNEATTLSVTAEQANAGKLRTSAGRRTERRIFAGVKFDF